MSSTNVIKCEICEKVVHKYKCPTCLVKYCSVQCFKAHKDECREIKEVVSKITPPQRTIEENGGDIVSDTEFTEDTVSQELLARLGQNPKLLDMLNNPHLQQILLDVDSSKTSEKSISNAMMEPLFTEFADACLQSIEPEKYETET